MTMNQIKLLQCPYCHWVHDHYCATGHKCGRCDSSISSARGEKILNRLVLLGYMTKRVEKKGKRTSFIYDIIKRVEQIKL